MLMSFLKILVEIGQHPKQKSDTVTVMEKIGHYLDEGNQALYDKFKADGHSRQEISKLIAENLDLQKYYKTLLLTGMAVMLWQDY